MTAKEAYDRRSEWLGTDLVLCLNVRSPSTVYRSIDVTKRGKIVLRGSPHFKPKTVKPDTSVVLE